MNVMSSPTFEGPMVGVEVGIVIVTEGGAVIPVAVMAAVPVLEVPEAAIPENPVMV